MELFALLQHSLFYGLVLSLLLGGLAWASFSINPEIWVHDYPPDIRARYGPISEKAKRQRMILALIFFPVLAAFLILSLIQLPRLTGGTLSFLPVFLSLFGILMVFNLIDLLVMDWLIWVVIQPRRIVLPGTEGMAGYRDFGFHFRGFLKGTLGLGLLSLVLAGITVLVGRLVL